MAVIDGTGQLRNDSARITELIATDLSASVPDCPGWTLRDLVVHLGGVHRWVIDAVLTAAPPQRARATDPVEGGAPEAPDELARWFGDGAIALANSLDRVGPDAPTWTPFPIESPHAEFWLRRQTHETALHRWDGEGAVGAQRPMDPVVASDGIDEYLSVILARLEQRDGLVLPMGSAHLHCTDVEGEWTVESLDGAVVIDRAHRKGDAAIRGTAQDLLLTLWGRTVPEGSVEVFGDESVGRAWTSLGGS